MVTWPEIAKLTPYSEQTLRKRFGGEMVDLGIVVKDYLLRGKMRVQTMWAFPANVRRYFMEKAQRGEL